MLALAACLVPLHHACPRISGWCPALLSFAGTLDEKMYQRQLKKGDLAATTMGGAGGGGGTSGGEAAKKAGGKFRRALGLVWVANNLLPTLQTAAATPVPLAGCCGFAACRAWLWLCAFVPCIHPHACLPATLVPCPVAARRS